ncbi:DNA polymerase III subunit beta [Nitratireductor luteus]|uniref:DNA polymerase III subunit beta n=1 Tax=Nitratireductor luteus TaxID=2976980 RepID=UPI00223FA17D|nr:DNA polymerase III subunit beta [Nitratireductor luteus]
MKLETTAGQLHSALKMVSGLVERVAVSPVLTSIKIEDGRLTATNLDMAASVTLPTIGKVEGTATVDYFALSALAKHTAHDERIALAEDSGLATASFNGSEYQMPSYPVSDFPDFGAVEGEATRSDNAGLIHALRRVRFAMSTEETRYYLNGVAFLLDRNEAPMLCATNGHRLALMPLPAAPDGSIGSIVPRHTVNFLARQKGEPSTVVFDQERRRSRFDLPGMTVSAKLIDGTFPDVNRVIPQDAVRLFSVDRAALMRTLRRLCAFSRSHGILRSVKLTGTPDGLTLSTSADGRRASERMSFVSPPEKPFECGYNADYLVDALAALNGETVAFASVDDIANSPTIISAEDDPLLIVQMPMRV